MAQTLELTFESALGKEATFTVDAPRADLTALELKTGMDSIIALGAFAVEGSLFAAAKGARIVERNVTEYEI
ncbi:DUF2922 domain-containing protein [Indiicoccus explosivorum]|uniref:DUF2922 domain-containing protein n=1 Tax=Indiicoccus explosivorum TaxID=1917864 RepID=UPI000B42F727|nr:DUF2922 domain-containing protein [Indiicoccus explosivorum]